MKRYIKPEETRIQRIRRYSVGAIVCCLYLVFSVWAGWGWLLLLPLVVDYYFTQYTNWSWGRNSNNPIVRNIVSLGGDIIFVVIAVSLLQTFFFQNFAIPSSSLEKTLLIGDYLYVDKLCYGPRMPITPLSLPLVHNELFGNKTYIEDPQLTYRRLPGYGQIERNDLVVFNFPAGDTVATKMTNPDYYTLCKLYGKERVDSDRATFGDVIYRPIDKRDHYVKRCIGMPGDKLQIVDNQVYINAKALENPPLIQLNYFLQTNGSELTRQVLDELEINYRDVQVIPLSQELSKEDCEMLYAQTGLSPIDSARGYVGRIYHLPLTEEMKRKLESEPYIRAIEVERVQKDSENFMYPLESNQGWTRDNYGPILIPHKGMTIELTPDNIITYRRCIDAYEGHRIEVNAEGEAIIDGSVAKTYTFGQNYYFMMGDNRHNSADSRAWGFVPEDHIVGKPAFVWLSLNDEQGWMSGRIRFSRLFTRITGR